MVRDAGFRYFLLLAERPLFQTSRDSEFTDLWTPALSFAAREGHVEIVRQLLAHKDIDVNASDFQMETALHSVMVPFMNERHLEVVRMLLAMGKKLTSVNSLDGYGSNAVKYAVLYGFKEVVEEFVKCDLVNLTKINLAPLNSRYLSSYIFGTLLSHQMG